MPRNKADRHAVPTPNADPIHLELRCHRCLGRSLNVCRPLDDTGLVDLLGLGAVVHRRKGELLFRAGDRQGPFFKITKGVVAVSSSLHDGRRQVVALRVPGDVVGYLEKNGKYAFEGQALTDVEACSFDRGRFDKLVADLPALAAAVVEALSDALTQAGHGLTAIGQLKATERVANFLAEFCALYEQRQMLTGPLTLPMRRNEIADYLGLAGATVSRALTKLKKRNVVGRSKDGHIIVLNPKMLQAFVIKNVSHG